MAAVADGAALARLAAAKCDAFGIGRLILNRLDTGAGMGKVTKGLRRTAAAGAPFIGFAFFNLSVIGKGLRNDGIGHLSTPCSQPLTVVNIANKYC